MPEQPVYHASVWKADDGWHWQVEADLSQLEDPLRDERRWNGVAESRAHAFDEVIDRLGLIESL